VKFERYIQENLDAEAKESGPRVGKIKKMETELKELHDRLEKLKVAHFNLADTAMARDRQNTTWRRKIMDLRERNRRAFNLPAPVDPWSRENMIHNPHLAQGQEDRPVKQPPPGKRNFTTIGALPSGE
jgi:hypothetical protein